MRGLGGGLNEPRDAIATGAYALLQNPTQRAQVESDPSLWRTAFEETVPWVAPIGMYPRQTMRDGARRDAHSRRRSYRRGDRVGQSRRVGFSRTLTLLTLIGPGSRMSLSAAARISARAHGPRGCWSVRWRCLCSSIGSGAYVFRRRSQFASVAGSFAGP